MLTALADGLWGAMAPVRFLGMELTANMTVIRLPAGGLILHSPVRMTDALRGEVEALGPVRHLYSPNLFHHLSLGTWAAAFPDAKVHAPPGLEAKRPDLRIHRFHGERPEPEFEGSLDELPIHGFRLKETVLHVRTARAVIVADLVHNIGRPRGRWTQLYTRAMGFYDRPAISRMLRWTAFSDRRAARASLDAVRALPFHTLLVGHGRPIRERAREVLGDAYAWLR